MVLTTKRFALHVILSIAVVAGAYAEDLNITPDQTRTLAEITAERTARGVTQPVDAHELVIDVPDPATLPVATVRYHERYGELDIIYPPDYDFKDPVPAVILISYFEDKISRRQNGVSYREYQQANEWASLIAGRGIAAILYDTAQPYFSAAAVLEFLSNNAQGLHVDPERLGLFGASAHVATETKILSKSNIPGIDGIKAFAVLYGAGFEGIPSGNPAAYIVEAGRDAEKYVQSTESYAQKLEEKGLDVTLVRYENGEHGFDVRQDTPRTREIIEGLLDFYSDRLSAVQ